MGGAPLQEFGLVFFQELESVQLSIHIVLGSNSIVMIFLVLVQHVMMSHTSTFLVSTGYTNEGMTFGQFAVQRSRGTPLRSKSIFTDASWTFPS